MSRKLAAYNIDSLWVQAGECKQRNIPKVRVRPATRSVVATCNSN